MSRRLNTSFVVTVAVGLAGCSPGQTSNPPPPPPPATSDVEVEPPSPPKPPAPLEPSPSETTVVPPVNPPPPEPDLPPAEPGAKVMKRANGTCWVMVEVKCPQATPGQPRPTCNPPPPRQVACPDDQ